MRTVVIVPSRLASTRLPEKPLALLHGKELIRWIFDNLKNSKNYDLYFAVDCEKLIDFCKKYSIPAIYTDPDLPSGTDRVHAAYCNLKKEYDFIINAQGDEPCMKSGYIESFIKFVSSYDSSTISSSIFTIAKESDDINSFNNPAHVKAVCTCQNYALYFSRSPIPFPRDAQSKIKFLKHFGIYGYAPEVLDKFVKLKPSFLEQTEKLEQLRWLENNGKIIVQKVDFDLISIDTKEDIEYFERKVTKDA
ncbi:MAG TPA: 3-deoxy-manno-octulosonate cytidylyltransferase [Exilispira sp.]|nr:3-deoxy-manno-octulosonate cytidylyltransferase [Exilispira sp.]